MTEDLNALGQSKYSDPEAIIVEWVGPYALGKVPDVCQGIDFDSGVYVAFGRHKRFAWWPLWWEARWIRSGLRQSSFRLDARPAAYPLQYVGIGLEVCNRAAIKAHHALQHLSLDQTDIWFAKPINRLHPDAKTEVGWPTAVFALEKILIFCLKPRWNKEGIKRVSAPICVAWCRAPDSTGLSRRHRNQVRRLPELIKFDPTNFVSVDFDLAHPDGRAIFKPRNASWAPVRAFKVWIEETFG